MTQRAEPLMEARGGGAIVTMTYLGGERAIPGYNVMGVAKAALDASMRYLAADLGPKNIRVNAISAGPVRTLAARGIAGFSQMEGVIAERAPLKRGIDADDVGQAGLYLLSPMAASVTGTILYVDAGLSRDGPLDDVIRRPALHVLGCAPASGNPGEPCSGYLVTRRRLARPARLRARGRLARCSRAMPRRSTPIVLSHLHFDHVADLIPLGYAHMFGLASDWKPPALYAPPGGEARLTALCEASGHGARSPRRRAD